MPKIAGGSIWCNTVAKHGIVGMTRALETEVAPFGITVNCLCPGWTNTRLVDFDSMGRAMGIDADAAKAMVARGNLQNRVLEPEELGPMAVLLCIRSVRRYHRSGNQCGRRV